MNAYEEELRNLELKYDQKIHEVINLRNTKMLESKNPVYNDFWMRVMTNHKVLNKMISDQDRESLKYIRNITYVKLEDGNVFL